MQALQHASKANGLPRDPADSDPARQQRVQALHRHDWVVNAKTLSVGLATA
jgi:hypothetical protein